MVVTVGGDADALAVGRHPDVGVGFGGTEVGVREPCPDGRGCGDDVEARVPEQLRERGGVDATDANPGHWTCEWAAVVGWWRCIRGGCARTGIRVSVVGGLCGVVSDWSLSVGVVYNRPRL